MSPLTSCNEPPTEGAGAAGVGFANPLAFSPPACPFPVLFCDFSPATAGCSYRQRAYRSMLSFKSSPVHEGTPERARPMLCRAGPHLRGEGRVGCTQGQAYAVQGGPTPEGEKEDG